MEKTEPMVAADKKKGKGNTKEKNGPAAVVMKTRGAVAAEQSNSFNDIWSRRKFDVLVKKRNSEERRTPPLPLGGYPQGKRLVCSTIASSILIFRVSMIV